MKTEQQGEAGAARGAGAAAPGDRASRRAEEAKAVFTTLNPDGTRRWLRPRLSLGRFLTRRRVVAYVLIALFWALPLVEVNGRPLVLLDIATRRFHILGTTFYPTDTLLIALLTVGVFLSIFWFTALLGRVWCGWACPQTVYMEFLFRPIERFFEGSPGRAAKGWMRTSGAGKALKYVVYAVCSFALAHAFLAYFVPWSELGKWVFGAPWRHPIGFGVVVFVTVAMMADFAYFREQVCVVMCPYGRMQSVMLDRQSLIIRYDTERGEPRGARSAKRDVSLPVLGDCVDCRMCVTTCPTGIDIRNGLQMECIGCAQCIDACDAVMEKIGRPRGLIRYSSQAAMEGERPRLLRPRVVMYPVVIAALAGLFTLALMNTGVADVTVLRGLGQPFVVKPDGDVENGVRVKIVNRMEKGAEFALSVEGGEGVRLVSEAEVVKVEAGQMVTTPVQVHSPRGGFAGGRRPVSIVVKGPEGFERRLPFVLLGPANGAGEAGGGR